MLARRGTDILREELRRRLDAGYQGPHEVWIRWPRQLGDVVFALPFFGSLQAAWNAEAAALGVSLRWVAVGHAIGAALFSEAAPDFIAESVIESGGVGKPDPWHLLRRWREAPPVCVINLSQSVRLALGAWMARVPIRGGISDNHLSLLYTHPFKYRDLPIHLAQRYEPLLEQLTGQRYLQWVRIGRHNLGGGRGPEILRAAGWAGEPYITLAFGTRGHVKRWFPETGTWPELARRLSEEGYRCVWLGGPDEVALGKEIAALAPGSLDLTGKTSLPEACAIQEAAAGHVAIDTGLAHTAAATGRPTLTLMGHSPEPLIAPVGPMAVAIRGSAVDSHRGESEGFETHGSVAHRVHPERVVGLLKALMAEARA
ncbi:MAG: glycosyltransferase family 9 protein [Geothrix sp.]|nr:glycosyltransferase family 9 protein [Geothrix sp.]